MQNRPDQESKKSIGNIELDINKTKEINDKILEALSTIITNDKNAGRVFKAWDSLRLALKLTSRLKSLHPHCYVEIVSHIEKNYDKLDAATQVICNQLLLACTHAALSNFITMANRKLEEDHKISHQRAVLLVALQKFPSVLNEFGLNVREELQKEQKILQDHADPLDTFLVRDLIEITGVDFAADKVKELPSPRMSMR